jgi:hypothetical protein
MAPSAPPAPEGAAAGRRKVGTRRARTSGAAQGARARARAGRAPLSPPARSAGAFFSDPPRAAPSQTPPTHNKTTTTTQIRVTALELHPTEPAIVVRYESADAAGGASAAGSKR